MNTKNPQYLNTTSIYKGAFTPATTTQREKSSVDFAEQFELAILKADQLQQKLEAINNQINNNYSRRGYQGF